VLCVRFSPDGKILAIAGGHHATHTGEVKLWDVAGRRELAALPHPHMAWSVQFSPDGRTLLTACWDKTAKLWELAVRKERAVLRGYSGGPQATPPARAQVDDLWKDLASPDASRAHRSLWALVEDGKRAVPFVQEQGRTLKQEKAASADPEYIGKLIAMLDADAVADRDKATDELAKLSKVAEPALRKALDG